MSSTFFEKFYWRWFAMELFYFCVGFKIFMEYEFQTGIVVKIKGSLSEIPYFDSRTNKLWILNH